MPSRLPVALDDGVVCGVFRHFFAVLPLTKSSPYAAAWCGGFRFVGGRAAGMPCQARGAAAAFQNERPRRGGRGLR